MALFRCIKCHTTASVTRRKQVRGAGDIVQVVEFQEDITFKPGAYGHEDIEVGGEYEINGRLAEKARNNTEYFEEVLPVAVVADTSKDAGESATTEKKQRGRPKKETANVGNSGGDTQQSA